MILPGEPAEDLRFATAVVHRPAVPALQLPDAHGNRRPPIEQPQELPVEPINPSSE